MIARNEREDLRDGFVPCSAVKDVIVVELVTVHDIVICGTELIGSLIPRLPPRQTLTLLFFFFSRARGESGNEASLLERKR